MIDEKENKDDIVLNVEDVYKSFGTLEILRGINLEAKRSETVVVLGRSGTGKSVILKCIIGLLDIDAGKIIAFGMDAQNLTKTDRPIFRKKIGYLFQSGALYDSMSIRENLEFPLIRQADFTRADLGDKVIDVLKSVGLEEVIDKMPSEISGGQMKRVAVARTLILEPEIILYDEPTTGLDPFTSKEISELIVKLKKERHVTSIVITHDIPCARIVADRVLILKDGVFYKQGTFEEMESSDDEFVKGFFDFK